MPSEYDALFDAQPAQQKSEYDALLEEPKSPSGVGQALKNAGEAALDVGKGLLKGLIPKVDIPTIASIALGPVGMGSFEAYKQAKGISDTVGQVQEAEQTPPFSKERFEAGFNVAAQLGMAALGAKAGLKEIAFGKESAPLASETAAAKEVINNATQEGVVKEDNIVQHPGDGEGGTPAETGSSGGTQPSTQAPPQKIATAPEAFPSLLQSAEEARRSELRQESAPVSEPTETTTAQPLTQEKGGEVGEKVQVKGKDEGEGKKGVLTPEAATVQPPAAPPEKVQPGEFGKTGYTAVDSESQPQVSAIANRFVEERVAKGELGAIAPGEGHSTAELIERGLKMPPEEINQHISDLMQKKGGDPVTQASAVRAKEASLSQRSSQLSREAEVDQANLEKKLAAENAMKDVTDFHIGPVARLNEIFHGVGMAKQGAIPIDVSTFNGIQEKWLKQTGELPPEDVKPILKKTAKRLSDANGEANGSRKALGDAIGKESTRRKSLHPDEIAKNIMERLKEQTPCG